VVLVLSRRGLFLGTGMIHVGFGGISAERAGELVIDVERGLLLDSSIHGYRELITRGGDINLFPVHYQW
jgi:hypothetical protein